MVVAADEAKIEEPAATFRMRDVTVDALQAWTGPRISPSAALAEMHRKMAAPGTAKH